MTSPAHTRQDGHPHRNLVTDDGYRIGALGDPSAFEVENQFRAIPQVSGPLVSISSPLAAFDALRTWTVTRFWSEKKLLVGPPAGPVPVAQDALGYLLDGEQPQRRIARQIEGSNPARYYIDRVVARAQFNEIAPVAVRYTAAMIHYIIETESVQLCAPTSGYRATFIPAGGADYESFGNSINREGDVAGFYGGWPYGVFYTRGADVAYVPRGSTAGFTGRALLNSAGTVALTAQLDSTTGFDGNTGAFVWDGNRLQNIGGLGGGRTEALNLSDSGVVVGLSSLEDGHYRAFAWSRGMAPRDLNFGPPESYSEAAGVNDLGQVCGVHAPQPNHGYPPSAAYSVFWNGMNSVFWNGMRVRDLGSNQGGVDGGGVLCQDLNNLGQSVGSVAVGKATVMIRADLWNGSSFVDLGDLGDQSSYARAINDRQQVVGSYATTSASDAPSRGFIWPDGLMRDLTDLTHWTDEGWVVLGAFDINNARQIAATAFKGGHRRAIRLDPL